MNPKMRSWLAWLLPFLVGGGLALGALIGWSLGSEAARQEGPAGDMAGAAGALMVVICLLAGFVVSVLTLILAKILRRGSPTRLLLRLALSLAAGGILGLLGTHPGGLAATAAWILLLSAPALLSWSWRTD
ncbi:MAG: hypothetical protein IPQ13_04205 [Holophagaceae bacterium]|nr:hypothetical protein [Holophagaceae bacterium]